MHPLIPLLFLFLFLLIAAGVGFIIYGVVTDIASKTSKKMEDHNVSVGKDGLKIAVKEVKHEDYVDSTRNVLVQAWNLSSWPGYKSRFWNKEKDSKSKSGKSSSSSGSKSRSGSSRSGASSPAVGSSSSRKHEHRTEGGRLAEPRPT